MRLVELDRPRISDIVPAGGLRNIIKALSHNRCQLMNGLSHEPEMASMRWNATEGSNHHRGTQQAQKQENGSNACVLQFSMCVNLDCRMRLFLMKQSNVREVILLARMTSSEAANAICGGCCAEVYPSGKSSNHSHNVDCRSKVL